MSGKIVYSSELGDLRKSEHKAKKAQKKQAQSLPSGIKHDGTVRIRRETRGRGGKTVCCIYGVPLSGPELGSLAAFLKQKCGTGGTVRDSVIIIQGDKSDTLIKLLSERGYTVKKSGS